MVKGTAHDGKESKEETRDIIKKLTRRLKISTNAESKIGEVRRLGQYESTNTGKVNNRKKAHRDFKPSQGLERNGYMDR